MSKFGKFQPAQPTSLMHSDPRTSPAIRDNLGEQLRTMYGNLEEEALPDRLLNLVRQLGQPHRRRKP
jgi:hypothetical protein